ncbi:hypothetical protein VFPBJ_07636 [Purpureocillium lilacinum]|uniref:Uncharacterized protein n=2 Tax=Purpureocillium lilacinum TaxID=33203 RepID=A0A179GH30_PURLI|nr:hypothetical protein Purlil1_1995 [Purpureocillium lilacinum]OAQ77164.1 hypothetical protein VFPBJ_07636 [Purpureocillium lilacinum]GJN75563.1 hypothetical protein PLICBS_009666 [Purpureocillium lilacinum]
MHFSRLLLAVGFLATAAIALPSGNPDAEAAMDLKEFCQRHPTICKKLLKGELGDAADVNDVLAARAKDAEAVDGLIPVHIPVHLPKQHHGTRSEGADEADVAGKLDPQKHHHTPGAHHGHPGPHPKRAEGENAVTDNDITDNNADEEFGALKGGGKGGGRARPKPKSKKPHCTHMGDGCGDASHCTSGSFRATAKQILICGICSCL